MPFCPKCRYEYEAGVKLCPDCKAALVEKLEEYEQIYHNPVYYDEDEEYMRELKEFLIKNDVKNVSVSFNEDRKMYELATDTASKNRATECLNMYFARELEEEDDSQEDEISKIQSQSLQYVKREDKYKDYYSTGILLMVIGIIGDIYIVLTALSLTPVKFEGVFAVLFYIVMGALFNIFLVGGIMSLKSAGKFKSEIGDEERLTKEIKDYITDNFDREFFEKQFSDSDEGSLYFARADFMKKEITEKFGELEISYLEDIIEQLYQEIFE